MDMISKSFSRSDDWDEQLPFLLFAYRVFAQKSTEESPFYLWLEPKTTHRKHIDITEISLHCKSGKLQDRFRYQFGMGSC